MALSPSFKGEVTAYTATTTNATNTVTATPLKSGAKVTITVGGEAHENGTAATWAAGENEVAVTVKYGTTVKTYTVTVTKS